MNIPSFFSSVSQINKIAERLMLSEENCNSILCIALCHISLNKDERITHKGEHSWSNVTIVNSWPNVCQIYFLSVIPLKVLG